MIYNSTLCFRFYHRDTPQIYYRGAIVQGPFYLPIALSITQSEEEADNVGG